MLGACVHLKRVHVPSTDSLCQRTITPLFGQSIEICTEARSEFWTKMASASASALRGGNCSPRRLPRVGICDLRGWNRLPGHHTDRGWRCQCCADASGMRPSKDDFVRRIGDRRIDTNRLHADMVRAETENHL